MINETSLCFKPVLNLIVSFCNRKLTKWFKWLRFFWLYQVSYLKCSGLVLFLFCFWINNYMYYRKWKHLTKTLFWPRAKMNLCIRHVHLRRPDNQLLSEKRAHFPSTKTGTIFFIRFLQSNTHIIVIFVTKLEYLRTQSNVKTFYFWFLCRAKQFFFSKLTSFFFFQKIQTNHHLWTTLFVQERF